MPSPFAPSANLWTIPEATIAKTGRREEILTTQNVVRTPEDVRELYPLRDFSEPGQADTSGRLPCRA